MLPETTTLLKRTFPSHFLPEIDTRYQRELRDKMAKDVLRITRAAINIEKNWETGDFDKDYGGPRFECLDEDEFVDAEVMMDPSTDGPMEFRRRSDLEDPDYRESSGIEYNPEAGTWKYKTETDDGKSTEPAAGKTETLAAAKAKKGTKKK